MHIYTHLFYKIEVTLLDLLTFFFNLALYPHTIKFFQKIFNGYIPLLEFILIYFWKMKMFPFFHDYNWIYCKLLWDDKHLVQSATVYRLGSPTPTLSGGGPCWHLICRCEGCSWKLSFTLEENLGKKNSREVRYHPGPKVNCAKWTLSG